MLKPKTVAKIRVLRQEGHSIPEISKLCHVSRSTALKYSSGVKILPEHEKRWLARRKSASVMAQNNWLLAEDKAKKIVRSLSTRDMVIIASCLYWAEGAKKDFLFANTDPVMIRVFLEVIRQGYGIEEADIKISIRIYEDINKQSSLEFWSLVTGQELGKETTVDVLKGKKKGKLAHGMCRIRIKKGGQLLKEFATIAKRLDRLLSPRSSMDRTATS